MKCAAALFSRIVEKHEVYNIIVRFSEVLGAATVPDKNILVLAGHVKLTALSPGHDYEWWGSS